MKQTILSILIAATCAMANAAPHDAAPAGFEQAKQKFAAAMQGDAGARDGAITAFEALAAANPDHPLLSAYAGAATTLKARDASEPWEKMKFAEKGANTLEKALAQLSPAHDEALFNGSPESIEVRVVAANTMLALPDFMGRRAPAKRAIEAALASPVFDKAQPQVRAAVYNAAAKAAGIEKRGEDEARFLKLAKEQAK